MNVAQIVRVEADPMGVNLRLWIDDERGQHLAVAEMRLPALSLARLVVAVEDEQERANQPELPFDD